MTPSDLFDQPYTCWTTRDIALKLFSADDAAALKKAERWIQEEKLDFVNIEEEQLKDEHERPAKQLVTTQVTERARKKRQTVLFAALHSTGEHTFLFANDARSGRRWVALPSQINESVINQALAAILSHEGKDVVVLPSGALVKQCRELTRQWSSNMTANGDNKLRIALEIYHHGRDDLHANVNPEQMLEPTEHMTHLDRLCISNRTSYQFCNDS